MKNEELKALDERDETQISGGNKWDDFKSAASDYASKGAKLAQKHKKGLFKAGLALGAVATAAGAVAADHYLNEGKVRKGLFSKLGGYSEADRQELEAWRKWAEEHPEIYEGQTVETPTTESPTDSAGASHLPSYLKT